MSSSHENLNSIHKVHSPFTSAVCVAFTPARLLCTFANSTSGQPVAGRCSNSTTGVSNLALGIDAGNQITTASNVIAIGHTAADVSDTTWIGNVFGVTTQSGTTAPVIVSNTGQLSTVASSERFKKNIATMEKASQAIL